MEEFRRSSDLELLEAVISGCSRRSGFSVHHTAITLSVSTSETGKEPFITSNRMAPGITDEVTAIR